MVGEFVATDAVGALRRAGYIPLGPGGRDGGNFTRQTRCLRMTYHGNSKEVKFQSFGAKTELRRRGYFTIPSMMAESRHMWASSCPGTPTLSPLA